MEKDESFWYVYTTSEDNYVLDEENYQKLRQAMLMGLVAVEVVGRAGEPIIQNVSQIVQVSYSSPEVRDAMFLWNQTRDEDRRDRKERLGIPDFD